jgi:pseudouridine kinase
MMRPLRQAADAERDIEAERARRNQLPKARSISIDLSFLPSFMIEPLPNGARSGRAPLPSALLCPPKVICPLRAANANLPSSALERLVAVAAGKPVFAIAISPAKVMRLKPVLSGLSVLFMNRREAAALTDLGDAAPQQEIVEALRQAGLAGGVITAGGALVLGFDRESTFSIATPAPRGVADVTGAGDALAGATVAGLLGGLPLREATRQGMAAATLAIESFDAVPRFSAAEFDEALALVPEAREVA